MGACPLGGAHQLTNPRWAGNSCRRCHKTWVWRDNVLVPTWSLPDQQPTPKEPDHG